MYADKPWRTGPLLRESQVTQTVHSLSATVDEAAFKNGGAFVAAIIIIEENPMNQLKTFLTAGTLALATVGAFAQTATPAADARQNNQSRRIEAGEKSGALTPHEANRMNRQQNAADKVESNAKADGTVTPAERAKTSAVEHRTSKNIRRQKTDAQTN